MLKHDILLPLKFFFALSLTKIPHRSAWYLDEHNKLNMSKLLIGFTQFFRENAHIVGTQLPYQESMPHLLLMAFLQRILNGGGEIKREYALGRKRVDLLAVWHNQKFVIELKIKYGEHTLTEGLKQTASYLDISGADEGHLVIFDRDPTKTWDEKISNELISFYTKKIHVWTL
jgi:hypothetical protein